MIKGKEDITNEEFEEILLPFYNNYNGYLIKFVIPDAIAFYLANGYSRIGLILRIKYNLKINKNCIKRSTT